jgi:hypothetical protein
MLADMIANVMATSASAAAFFLAVFTDAGILPLTKAIASPKGNLLNALILSSRRAATHWLKTTRLLGMQQPADVLSTNPRVSSGLEYVRLEAGRSLSKLSDVG